MRKILVMLIAAFVVVSFGTAMAADSVTLQITNPQVRVYNGPVFSTDSTGASAYVITGAPNTDPTIPVEGGATLYAIKDTATAGTLFARSLRFFSGATPVGSPALVSGTSRYVVVNMQAPTSSVVSGTDTGTTVYAIDGLNGATIWQRGIAANGSPVTSNQGFGLFDAAAGGTPYSLASLTIDTTNTGFSGATIYGISGGTNVGAGSGVSLWAISAQTGNFTTVKGNSNVTGFTLTTNPNSAGVSVVHTSPVISGNSLFVVGQSFTYSGASIYQFDKDDIYSGVKKVSLVGLQADRSQQWIPTPVVSGGSIFVVDTQGGVSSYRTDNLSLNYSARYTTSRITTGVTASPVTDGTYIVLCSTSGVTVTKLNNVSNLSTSNRQFYYEFSSIPNAQIWATPAISNGYVWVTVNSGTANSYVYRFTLSNTTNGDPTLLATYAGVPTFASPIIVGGNLWTATYASGVITKEAAAGANGNAYWPQFKFSAAKTGANTASSSQAPVDDDDSGCFISTVK